MLGAESTPGILHSVGLLFKEGYSCSGDCPERVHRDNSWGEVVNTLKTGWAILYQREKVLDTV